MARAPGPQNPGKYPFIGPNYQKYGEQPGYVYFPWTDTYKPDPKLAGDYAQQQGLIEKPKKQGLGETILPVAATAGAIYGAQSLAPELVGSYSKGTGLAGYGKDVVEGAKSGFGGLYDAGKAKLGFGQATAPTQAQAGVSAPRTAAPAMDAGGADFAPTPALDAQMAPGGAMSGKPVQPAMTPAGGEIPAGHTAVGTAADGSTISVPSETVAEDGSLNIDLDSALQGAAGAYQLYQGYQDYKQGNYVGAGINTASGANSVASAAGYGLEGTAGTALGVIGGLYSAYQMQKTQSDAPSGGRRNTNATMQGAAAGAAIGSVIPVVGTAVGAAIGALVGFGGSYFGSSKGERQMIRDAGRKGMMEAGLIDQDYKGTLADGSVYDFGKDGKGFGKEYKNDSNAGQINALANVIASTEGTTGKARESMAALYSNAALSNSNGDYNKALANIQHFANQRGMNLENVQGQLKQMFDEGNLSEHEYQVFSNDANKIFGGPMNGMQKAAQMVAQNNQMAAQNRPGFGGGPLMSPQAAQQAQMQANRPAPGQFPQIQPNPQPQMLQPQMQANRPAAGQFPQMQNPNQAFLKRGLFGAGYDKGRS